MAWNPTPDVAVARDAMKHFGAFGAVVIYLKADGHVGYASCGANAKLCPEMAKLGEVLIAKTQEFYQ